MPFTKETASLAGKKSKRGKEETTVAIRKAMAGYLDPKDLFAQIAQLPVREQVQAKIKLISYILPKLAAVDITMNDISVRDFMAMSSDQQDAYIRELPQRN